MYPWPTQEWRRNLISKNNIMRKERSLSSKSNQPFNVPNYVTIATQEAPREPSRVILRNYSAAIRRCGRFEGSDGRLVGRGPPYAEGLGSPLRLRHQLRSN